MNRGRGHTSVHSTVYTGALEDHVLIIRFNSGGTTNLFSIVKPPLTTPTHEVPGSGFPRFWLALGIFHPERQT